MKLEIPYLTNAVGLEEYKPEVVERTVVDGWSSEPMAAEAFPPLLLRVDGHFHSVVALMVEAVGPKWETACEWRTNWDGCLSNSARCCSRKRKRQPLDWKLLQH